MEGSSLRGSPRKHTPDRTGWQMTNRSAQDSAQELLRAVVLGIEIVRLATAPEKVFRCADTG